jgi:LysM repeat protein
LASGCGGGYKLSKGPAVAPVSPPEAPLASPIIPGPLEIPVSSLETPSEPLTNQLVSQTGDLFAEQEKIFLVEDAPLWVSLGDAGSLFSYPAVEENPARISEKIPREPGGTLPPEKKKISSPQRSAKALGRPSENDPLADPSAPKRGADKSLPEIPTGDFSASAGTSLFPLEAMEATGLFRESSSQAEATVMNPGAPGEASSEAPLSGAKTSAANAAAHTFPSLLNDKVKDFISLFQGRAESFFSRSLARSQAYEEMMKRIFREKNLPEELFYLALIESGYNPTALSRAKASGIWQFIAQTAKRFGLRVDKWVDERRDPEKSTLAAAEYLKNLHGMFNNWDLATAGYNAGEGKILTAMKKAQSEDFWEISNHRYLKKETKEYVPMFLAAMTIAKEPQKYGFSNIEYHPPLVYEKVAVPPSTGLALIAKAAETDLSEIRALNPALLREKTPPNLPRFEINLPSGKKEVFEKNFASLSRSLASKNTHRVSSGDTLSRLAKKYTVTVQELCQANAMTPQAVLKPGSFLKIPQ